MRWAARALRLGSTDECLHRIAMDWEPIVSHLDGRRPALVVDGGGRVRFVNAPMEKLLGRRFDELTTTRWLALCVQPGATSIVKHLLGAGFRGEATDGDLPLVTREGRRITMHAELSRETRGRRRALVVVSQGVREVEAGSTRAGDSQCEVSKTGKGGIVTLARFLDPTRDPQSHIGRPIEELLNALGCGPAMRWVGKVLAD